MELAKEKRGHFFYLFILSDSKLFKICCVLAQCLVYWIHFPNYFIRFCCLFLKSLKAFKVSLNRFFIKYSKFSFVRIKISFMFITKFWYKFIHHIERYQIMWLRKTNGCLMVVFQKFCHLNTFFQVCCWSFGGKSWPTLVVV